MKQKNSHVGILGDFFNSPFITRIGLCLTSREAGLWSQILSLEDDQDFQTNSVRLRAFIGRLVDARVVQMIEEGRYRITVPLDRIVCVEIYRRARVKVLPAEVETITSLQRTVVNILTLHGRTSVNSVQMMAGSRCPIERLGILIDGPDSEPLLCPIGFAMAELVPMSASALGDKQRKLPFPLPDFYLADPGPNIPRKWMVGSALMAPLAETWEVLIAIVRGVVSPMSNRLLAKRKRRPLAPPSPAPPAVIAPPEPTPVAPIPTPPPDPDPLPALPLGLLPALSALLSRAHPTSARNILRQLGELSGSGDTSPPP